MKSYFEISKVQSKTAKKVIIILAIIASCIVVSVGKSLRKNGDVSRREDGIHAITS